MFAWKFLQVVSLYFLFVIADEEEKRLRVLYDWYFHTSDHAIKEVFFYRLWKVGVIAMPLTLLTD
jgi:hypothetical protein